MVGFQRMQFSRLLLVFISLIFFKTSFANGELARGIEQFNASNFLKTLPEFLRFLPTSLKASPVFIYQSASLQEASFEFPRAILSNPQGTLVLSFNGHSSQGGYERIEAFDFSEDEAKFRFYEINFVNNRAVLSNPNPSKCLTCHRADPRPNWESYDQWPGSFGSQDDHLSDIEMPSFKSLLKTFPSHERYRSLRLSQFAPVLNSPRYTGRMPGDPNITLTARLSKNNLKRVARIITESEDYAIYRYLILASLTCTSEIEQSGALPEKYLPLLSYYTSKQIREAVAIQTSIGSGTSYESTLRFRSLFDSRGIDTSDWFMNFKGALTNNFLNGTDWQSELQEMLLERDPELKSYRVSQSDAVDCWKLITKNEEVLSGKPLKQELRSFEKDPEVPQRIWDRACLQCHDLGSANQMTFAEAKQKKAFRRHVANGTMPKNQTLTPSEIDALLK